MKTIRILGVPMDLGQNRRGVDMGPSALRYAGLNTRLERLGHTVVDGGNLPVPVPDEVPAGLNQERLDVVAAVCERIYERGRASLAAGEIALFLGGDHSISIGSVKAALSQSDANTNNGNVGVIWIDAHGDFNTPASSPSGNIHGMPVAVLRGEGDASLIETGGGRTIAAENIVMIGIRDVDEKERTRLQSSNIAIFTMRDIDENGMGNIARQAIAKLAHCEQLHISLDMDSLNPDEAPGVGTPVQGGLSYREAHLLMELLADSGRVRSADVVEINPILDVGNRTAELAVELIASLMGKKIL